MISYRPSVEMGFTDLGWIKARHHFKFAGAQNVDLLNWGRLRAINHNILAPGFATTPASHHGTEVLYVVETGIIEFRQNDGYHCLVAAGQFLSIYTGSGISFSIANTTSKEIKFTEIWLTCDTSRDSPIVRRHRARTLEAKSTDSQTPYQEISLENCSAAIKFLQVAKGVSVEISERCEKSYLAVLGGSCTHDEVSLNMYDGVLMEGEQALAISTEQQADLVLIEMMNGIH